MTHTTHGKSRTKLALGATIVLAAAPVPVFAQATADPAASSAPVSAPVSAPAPVVVIPEAAPAATPVTSAPVTSAPIATAPVAAAPVVEPAVPATATTGTTDAATTQPRPSSRTAKAAPVRATAPHQAEPAARIVAPALAATTPATSPAPAPVSAVPANPAGIDQVDGAPPVTATNPVPATDGTVPHGLLGALGLAAVAGAGVFALRRRRTQSDIADEAYVTPTEPMALTPEPITPAEARPLDLAAPVAHAPLAVASIPLARTSPLLDARPLLDEGEPAPTGEARQELLDQMVAAEPDEANPFRSAQARRRRARLILQSHDARAAELAHERGIDPSFDWRNWHGTGTSPAPSPTPARMPEPVN